jgi:hypothetical protein
MLSMINTDGSAGQMIAAVALIKMNVSPVIAVRIGFGGDNHTDADLLKSEVPQHITGVAAIAGLMKLLEDNQLQDRVTFAMYNVFGRTLAKLGKAGRDHWGSHHATIMIGKHLRPGVVGGLEPKAKDYYATSIDSKTGKPVMADGGDIKFNEGLAAMSKTLGAAIGMKRDALDAHIMGGKVVGSAVAI